MAGHRINLYRTGPLAQADLSMADTLAIPPARRMAIDAEIRARLAALDAEPAPT